MQIRRKFSLLTRQRAETERSNRLLIGKQFARRLNLSLETTFKDSEVFSLAIRDASQNFAA